MLRRSIIPVFVIATLGVPAFCQSADNPRFDVISIRRSNPDYRLRRVALSCTGGRFLATGTGPIRAILWAWDISPMEAFRLSGAPEWARGVDAFVDIEARTDRVINEAECKLMVRNLFADRFGLTAHWEEREGPIFALVVSPKGLKAKAVSETDGTLNGPGFTIDGAPMPMLDANLTGWTMDQLASVLSVANLDRPIFNRTGLPGIYRIALSFRQRSSEGDGPEVTTALEDQLGLRLEPRKEPLKMLVIDSMKKPEPN